MAFSKARRLSDFIAADGSIPTGKFASSTITSAHLVDGTIAHADLHTNMDLTGKTVLVANASTGDSDTTAANTAFVQQEIAALVDSSPSALNTLNELAAALGDDANFSTTVTNSIATKLPLAGGTLTGDLILGDNVKVEIGSASGGDLQLYHDGSNSYIKSTTGWLNMPIGGNGISIANSDFSEQLAKFLVNGAVELYHNGSKKLETASGGVTVTGNLQGTSLTVGTANDAGEALNIVDGGHTGQGTANTVSLASFGENVSGNTAGIWLGSMTNENTAVIGTRTASGNIGFQTYDGSSWGERLRLTHLGQLGLGVTPDTFSSGYTALQINGYAYNIAHSGGDHYITNNAYFNSGWKYGQTSTAQKVELASGRITLMTAASGSADSAITWKTGLVQDSVGKIGIKETSPLDMLHIGAEAGVADAVIRLDSNSVNNNAYGLKWYDGTTQKAEIIWAESNANLKIRNFRADNSDSYGRIDFDVGDTSNPPTKMTIQGHNGHIGMGLTDPAKPLHLKRTSGWATMRLEGASDSGGELEFYAGSSLKAKLWADVNAGDIYIRAGGTNTTAILAGDGNWVGPHEDNVKRNFIGRGPFNVFDFSDHWHEFYNPAANTEHSISGSFTNAMGVTMTFPTNVSKKILQHDRTPTGTVGVIYEAVSDSNSTWNGGFASGQFRTDPDKGYIFGYYSRRITSASNGTHYAGFSHGVSAGTGSTVDSNPYFQAFGNGSLPQGVWTLHYYHLHPRYYSGTGDGGIGGVYRCDNGTRILGQTAWKQPVNQTYQTFRSYNYYCANTSVAIQWYAPFVYEVNGHEPTPAALLVNT